MMRTICRRQLEPDHIITSNAGRLSDGNSQVIRKHNILTELVAKLIQLHLCTGPQIREVRRK
jgi:hypothetical protein